MAEPQSKEERAAYRDRLRNKLTEDNLIDQIIDHVASGGSVIGLAKTWDLKFADVIRFVRADPERQKRYDKALVDRGEWAMESILNELSAIAHVDIRLAFDKNGELLPIQEIPEDVARAIAGIDVDEIWEGSGEGRAQVGVTRKLKFWNKLEALVERGKELGMFTQKVKISADAKLEDLLTLSRETPKPAAPPADSSATPPL